MCLYFLSLRKPKRATEYQEGPQEGLEMGQSESGGGSPIWVKAKV